MPIDPITILMFALIALLIFFMFRNNRKRQAAQQQLQSNLRPGAEVMLQSGIFGTIESIEEDENRATLRSGTTTMVVHRNAIAQVVTPVEGAASDETAGAVAPDDDPEFGERVAQSNDAASTESSTQADKTNEAAAAGNGTDDAADDTSKDSPTASSDADSTDAASSDAKPSNEADASGEADSDRTSSDQASSDQASSDQASSDKPKP